MVLLLQILLLPRSLPRSRLVRDRGRRHPANLVFAVDQLRHIFAPCSRRHLPFWWASKLGLQIPMPKARHLGIATLSMYTPL